jgi:hypothetical protein
MPVHNKASQWDAKTAASLWFFHPCWRLYMFCPFKEFK